MNLKWQLPNLSLDLGSLEAGSGLDAISRQNFDDKAKALSSKFESKSVGFFDWPEICSDAELTAVEKMAKALRKDFEGALIFGIGGSYLGPATILQALHTPKSATEFPIHWISNADSRAITHAEDFVKKKKVATVVTSKSGNTVETLSAFFHLSRHLDPNGYVVITDPENGLLRRTAKQQGWKSLPLSPNIGGRFSVLTAVGLLPAALGGLDVRGLMEGAKSMRRALLSFSPHENPAYTFAVLSYLWDTKKSRTIQYLTPYHSGLALFADWFVQLWAESLGKNGRGPSPVAALGTTDQHSLLQLWKEGPGNKIVGFLDVLSSGLGEKICRPAFDVEFDDNLSQHTFDQVSHLASLATQESLTNAHVPTYRIEVADLNEATLGSLFFFFETACAYAGEWYAVNAFDQPGVEEAKRLLRQALASTRHAPNSSI